MDKSSVLGDAIRYLEYLQERVRVLEEQAANPTIESMAAVNNSQLIVDDEGSVDGDSEKSNDQRLAEIRLPEIEARVCSKNILLKIQCEKRKGILVKILAEVDMLNLTVVNISVAPFGSLALDITIIAEMEEQFSLLTADIVSALRSALQATA